MSLHKEGKKDFTKSFITDVIEWDIPTWSRALFLWDKILKKHLPGKDAVGLEIGSRHGGLTLYLAKKYNVKMYCSDYAGPSNEAVTKHERYNVRELVEYAAIDAFKIPFPDNSFDVIAFKSVLGSLGYTKAGIDKQLQVNAINEFYRVLKPGGILLFAENLKGSLIHQTLRKKYKRWGHKWRYVTPGEMIEFLEPFTEVKYQAFGFFGAFVTRNFLKKLITPIEWLMSKILPASASYVVFGGAVKPK